MSKEEHDARAALGREVNYEKPYFHKAILALRKQDLSRPRILDIGAGNGEFAELAKRALNAEVTCHDYALPHLRKLESLGFETVKVNFDNAKDVRKAAQELKGRFDVVTAFELIEHIFALDDLLSFAHSVLRPGGMLIVSTPNLDYSFYHVYNLLLGNIPPGEGHHVRFFNRRRLTQSLVLDGFKVEEELSYGEGATHWDRIIGDRGEWAKFLVKASGKIIDLLVPNYSSRRYSKLMMVAKREDGPLLGMDRTWREPHYESLTPAEREKVIDRIAPYRKSGLFRDMPGFRKFFDHEYKKTHS